MKARYYVAYPQDLDMPEEIIHRAVTEVVVRNHRRAQSVPDAFRQAFEE